VVTRDERAQLRFPELVYRVLYAVLPRLINIASSAATAFSNTPTVGAHPNTSKYGLTCAKFTVTRLVSVCKHAITPSYIFKDTA
jgi:hypothetical protein